MPREKFQALTEQMFYILLCLKDECCGMDIMTKVDQLTLGRVRVGPGTLYNLLEQFADAGFIRLTKTEGRRRSYILTDKGRTTLRDEYERLRRQAEDYRRFYGEEDHKRKSSVNFPGLPCGMPRAWQRIWKTWRQRAGSSREPTGSAAGNTRNVCPGRCAGL